MRYATQAPQAPYEARIYPGADARFTLYEDDNGTYAYEKGAYATYDLVWNERPERCASARGAAASRHDIQREPTSC